MKINGCEVLQGELFHKLYTQLAMNVLKFREKILTDIKNTRKQNY